MTKTESVVQAAIVRSVSHNEIVHLDWERDDLSYCHLELALAAVCEGDVVSGATHEYWGTTPEGGEWRVHLDNDPFAPLKPVDVCAEEANVRRAVCACADESVRDQALESLARLVTVATSRS